MMTGLIVTGTTVTGLTAGSWGRAVVGGGAVADGEEERVVTEEEVAEMVEAGPGSTCGVFLGVVVNARTSN